MKLLPRAMQSTVWGSSRQTGAEPKVKLTGFLGEAAVYEGWIIVDGTPVTTGRFNIDADGAALPKSAVATCSPSLPWWMPKQFLPTQPS